jgi:hypothetical protein
MRNALISRLEQIEKRSTEGEGELVVRFCRLRGLPAEYSGERHSVIVPDASTEGQYVIEERRGPEPENLDALNYPQPGIYLDVQFVPSPPEGHGFDR